MSTPLPAVPSKADLVYEHISAEILNGALQPGQRLSMDALARTLGVSKIPIREAMLRLESHGLVVQQQHAGPTVARISAHQLRGVYLARQEIEPLAARLAAPLIDATALDRLDRLQMSMREHLLAGRLAEISPLNSAFHETVAQATGFEILVEFTERLLTAVRRYRVSAPLEADNWRRVIAEHDAIVTALRAHDADAAAVAARTHAASQADHDTAR
ncbi:GntR family transcriptional regulator [Actinocatenispora thailandica]|uniref:GntR family transcriptional regulator n=1 Tax=Actinocatenispora thailandica TaxID=227318 RepID=A0A7R7DSL1_9ACTN|nr:GntR family transcriptional regulator [Actinocatenispora thailandica]BCJ37048.1 GntR family transcriptional regulator [Actinocatenispora thailandica]